MIETRQFRIRPDTLEHYSIISEINKKLSDTEYILRYAIVAKNPDYLAIEASITDNSILGRNLSIPYELNNNFVVVNVVPTGIRATIGGYIADATPATNLMASIADKVITHPNVVNGSFLNYAKDNVLYVEGFLLDKFLQNKTALAEVYQNKIGVVIDRGAIDTKNPLLFEHDRGLQLIINTINALRAIVGIDVIGYRITDEPVGGEAVRMPSGAYCGKVNNIDAVLNASRELIKRGATAIAVVTHIKIDENELDKYLSGEIPNPYGGTEALISHSISAEFDIPAAHAPILSKAETDYYNSCGIVDPRAASEFVSPAYLGCILKGLHQAPQPAANGITLSDVKAIVVPYDCCGGVPALMAKYYDIPLIAVSENRTILNVSPQKMEIKNVIVVNNYIEAAGVLSALKAGISINSLRRPIESVKQI